MHSNQLEIDFIKLFRLSAGKFSDTITCQQFVETLETAGYEYCAGSLKDRTDFMSLARALSCTQANAAVGTINFVQFLEDSRTQPFKWWHDRLMTFLPEGRSDMAPADLGNLLQD